MYARIRFVEEYLENKSHEIPSQMIGKRSHKKTDGDGEQNSDNKKKVKLN